jgi:hypothetical protein
MRSLRGDRSRLRLPLERLLGVLVRHAAAEKLRCRRVVAGHRDERTGRQRVGILGVSAKRRPRLGAGRLGDGLQSLGTFGDCST